MKDLLADWLKFAEDVQPGCAWGESELESLRARTEAAIVALDCEEGGKNLFGLLLPGLWAVPDEA